MARVAPRCLLTPYPGKDLAVFGDEAVDPRRDNWQRYEPSSSTASWKAQMLNLNRSFPNLLVATLATLPSYVGDPITSIRSERFLNATLRRPAVVG